MPQSVKIKTHKPGSSYSESHFFILSKGNNSGKPLISPCPNCFVLLAESESERELLYWLCFGLWQGGCFRICLCGSVIPFIHLRDVKNLLAVACEKVADKKEAFAKAVEVLRCCIAQEEKIAHQLKLMQEAKKLIMYKLLQ